MSRVSPLYKRAEIRKKNVKDKMKVQLLLLAKCGIIFLFFLSFFSSALLSRFVLTDVQIHFFSIPYDSFVTTTHVKQAMQKTSALFTMVFFLCLIVVKKKSHVWQKFEFLMFGHRFLASLQHMKLSENYLEIFLVAQPVLCSFLSIYLVENYDA
jgi:hypothetical protein